MSLIILDCKVKHNPSEGKIVSAIGVPFSKVGRTIKGQSCGSSCHLCTRRGAEAILVYVQGKTNNTHTHTKGQGDPHKEKT